MTPDGRSQAAAYLRSVIRDHQGKQSRLLAAVFSEEWLPPPDGNPIHQRAGHWRIRDGLERVFEEYPRLRQAFERWLQLARDSG